MNALQLALAASLGVALCWRLVDAKDGLELFAFSLMAVALIVVVVVGYLIHRQE